MYPITIAFKPQIDQHRANILNCSNLSNEFFLNEDCLGHLPPELSSPSQITHLPFSMSLATSGYQLIAELEVCGLKEKIKGYFKLVLIIQGQLATC